MLTPQEFSAKVKSKYPEYQNVDDLELARKVVEKYPEYKSQVNFSDQGPTSTLPVVEQKTMRSVDSFSQAEKRPDNPEYVEAIKQRNLSDPNFQVESVKAPGTDYQAMEKIKEESRTGQAIQSGVDAFKGATERAVEGVGEIKGAFQQKEVLDKRFADLDNALKTGVISKEEYDIKKAKAEERMRGVTGEAVAGAAGVIRAGAEGVMSPLTGAITGGLKPEIEKVGAFAGRKFEEMEPEKQQKLQSAIAALQEFGDENPALRDVAMTALEVAGMTKGLGFAEQAGSQALKVGKKVGEEVAEKTIETAPKIYAGVKKGMEAIDDALVTRKTLKEGAKVESVAKKVQKLVQPDPNKVKELQTAMKEGRLIRGKKGFFSGQAPDVIELTERVTDASKTVAKNFPEAAKMNDAQLFTGLKNKVSALSEKLKPELEKIRLKKEVLDEAKSTWEKVKAMQNDNEVLQSFAGLKTSQRNFENILDSFKQSLKTPDGKFRVKNLDDLWEKAKNYDATVKEKIKNSVGKQVDSAAFLEEVWLQNREILRDLLKKEAERLGVDAQGFFKEMQDYYTIQNELLRGVKKTKSTAGFITPKRVIGGLGSVVGLGALSKLAD